MTNSVQKPHPEASQKLILVVDDDPDFVMQTRFQLERAGYRVETADGRGSAEKALDTIKPDVAVLDLMMEDMDAGFILSRFLRKRLPGMPIIMVSAVTADTGLDFNWQNQDGRSWTNADVILTKPIRFEQLKREIERLTAV